MTNTKAQQALDFVQEQAARCATETELHNAFFGVGGRFGELFPTRSERSDFQNTAEYMEIGRILAEVKRRQDAEIKTKAKQLLELVKQRVASGASATDVHNACFGIGGRFSELFPTRPERDAFMQTPEYKEIFDIRVSLREQEKATS
ncbi:MAG: hypothetical protein ABI614_25235 [Planctomycetota bacterium]